MQSLIRGDTSAKADLHPHVAFQLEQASPTRQHLQVLRKMGERRATVTLISPNPSPPSARCSPRTSRACVSMFRMVLNRKCEDNSVATAKILASWSSVFSVAAKPVLSESMVDALSVSIFGPMWDQGLHDACMATCLTWHTAVWPSSSYLQYPRRQPAFPKHPW